MSREHLTLENRQMIEHMLNDKHNLAEIARALQKNRSTIGREIKAHITIRRTGGEGFCYNNCAIRYSCTRTQICYPCKAFRKQKLCRRCSLCNVNCKWYVPDSCKKLLKAPYVCNGCVFEKMCKKDHAYYSAYKAQRAYEHELSASRKGVRATVEELDRLDRIISPLVRQGQSLNHILANHKDEIGLSEKTLYNYVNANVFEVKDIHLPKKVSYRPRKQERPVLSRKEYKYRAGRTIEVFNEFREQNPDIPIIEMDTVKSASGCVKCLLTMSFVASQFLIAFLLRNGSATSVLEVFDNLTDKLGVQTFRELFPVILTDNGPEFKDPLCLEHSRTNCLRTRIFYCDPQASWQKPHIERIHVELRKIIPKGTSFSKLTPSDVTLALRHVNSEPREILDNKTPFDVFTGKNEKKLLDLLHLSPIPPDDVMLSHKLLNLRKR